MIGRRGAQQPSTRPLREFLMRAYIRRCRLWPGLVEAPRNYAELMGFTREGRGPEALRRAVRELPP